MSDPTVLIPIFFLAFLVEGLVEYFARPLIHPGIRAWLQNQVAGDDTQDRPDPTTQPIILRYVAALTGIGLCLAFSVDVLALLGLQAGWPVLGQIITGILIGRGSNYMHDLSDRWLQAQR